MLVLTALAVASAAEPAPATPVATAAAGPSSAAAIGRMEVEATMPTEVRVDGIKVGEILVPGVLSFEAAAGPHAVRIYTRGQPTELSVVVPTAGVVRVVAGRSGVVVADAAAAPAPPKGPAAVEFRSIGEVSVAMRLGDARRTVGPGEGVAFELTSGLHPFSVRSLDGTVIWANGLLSVDGGAPLVVLLGEGRMPEVTGAGRFVADGG